jgi:hypothetical protein
MEQLWIVTFMEKKWKDFWFWPHGKEWKDFSYAA